MSIAVTIPVDRAGMVVVSAAPPELADPQARRQPAHLDLARRPGGLRMDLSLDGGRFLRLPGVGVADESGGATAELASISFDVTPAGMVLSAQGTGGAPRPLAVDETTARQLATALLLTFRVKLTKAERLQQDR